MSLLTPGCLSRALPTNLATEADIVILVEYLPILGTFDRQGRPLLLDAESSRPPTALT
jgi:hypothetical protein